MKAELIILLIAYCSVAVAQGRIQTICGEAVYNAPSTVSIEEAKIIAVERARINALAEEFGTLINQYNTTVVSNQNGKSDIDFRSLSGSEVKGEWLEDTKEPELTIRYEQNMLVVKATVCGKARELTRAAITFQAKLLRNGTDERNESLRFVSGDDLYLWFQSPANGYLAVYLVDDKQNAYCLLPYSRDKTGQQIIQNGEKYLFFSYVNADALQKQIVDELAVSAEKDVEYNQIYIIFSPNSYTKALDSQKDQRLPRELPFNEFQRWLTKNRNLDKDMQVNVQYIEIKNK